MAAGDLTMTEIQPILFSAAQEISAERYGCIAAVNTSFDNKMVAKGDVVKVPYTGAQTSSAFSPAAYAPLGTAQTASAVSVEITASETCSWSINAEQEQSLQNGGNFVEYQRQQMAQSMRTIRNKMDAAAAVAVKEGASRAIGTAGTTPFASDISTINAASYELKLNGAPMTDPQLVVGCAAYQNLGNLGFFNQAQIAGGASEVQTGRLLNRYGFSISESANIAAHVKGAGTGYDVTSAGAAVGDMSIPIEGGTINTTGILKGDVVTFAGGTADANKYVVGTGLVATSGSISLNRPGLKVLKVDADEMTIGNAYTPCFAFERSAVVGIVRAPMFTFGNGYTGGVVTDGKGFTYLYIEALQFGIKTYFIAAAWGFKAVNPAHIVTILG